MSSSPYDVSSGYHCVMHLRLFIHLKLYRKLLIYFNNTSTMSQTIYNFEKIFNYRILKHYYTWVGIKTRENVLYEYTFYTVKETDRKTKTK